MIRLTRLAIDGFRGIYQIDMDFTRKESLLLLGLNGTGKTSMNLAIAFAFTGELLPISNADIILDPTVYRHKALSAQKKAQVKVWFVSKGAMYWICREIDDLGEISVTASDPAVISMISGALDQYCFLTRHQFSSMVDAVERESWRRLTPLLGHSDLAALRQGLRSLSLSIKRDLGFSGVQQQVDSSKRLYDVANAKLIQDMERAKLDKLGLEEVTDEIRSIVSNAPVFRSFSEIPWADLEQSLPGANQLKQIAAQLQELKSHVAATETRTVDESSINTALEALYELHTNRGLAHELLHAHFLTASQSAIRSLKDEVCPLCGISYPDWDEVRTTVDRRVEELSDLSKKFEQAVKTIKHQHAITESTVNLDLVDPQTLIPNFSSFYQIALKLQQLFDGVLSRQASPPVQGISAEDKEVILNTVRDYNSASKDFHKACTKRTEELDVQLQKVSGSTEIKRFYDLRAAVNSLLECERHEAKHTRLSKRLAEMEKIISTVQAYCDSFDKSESQFSGQLLKTLESEVQRIFAVLTGQTYLVPAIIPNTYRGVRNAEIMVKDFHGMGSVTARDYLSEAYRNSLGLAIWFAGLFRNPPALEFMVLDDITHSSDTQNRRNLANFVQIELADRFQLLVLTHDDNWYARLRSLVEQNRWNYQKVTKWNLQGLTLASDTWSSFLQSARDKIDNLDSSAGNDLRQSMEEFMDDICDALKLPVTFHKQSLPSFEEKRSALERAMHEAWKGGQGFIDPSSNAVRLLRNNQRIGNLSSHNSTSEQWSFADLSEAWDDVHALVSAFACTNDSGTCRGYPSSLKKKEWQISSM